MPYSYDGSGNIIEIGNDEFIYDDVGRLVQAEVNNARRKYEYDGFGNRLKCSHDNPASAGVKESGPVPPGKYLIGRAYRHTGLAGDDRIDMVYWRAWWVCTERIAGRNDEESVWILDHVARRANVSGSELVRMRQLMEQQRALPKVKGKR